MLTLTRFLFKAHLRQGYFSTYQLFSEKPVPSKAFLVGKFCHVPTCVFHHHHHHHHHHPHPHPHPHPDHRRHRHYWPTHPSSHPPLSIIVRLNPLKVAFWWSLPPSMWCLCCVAWRPGNPTTVAPEIAPLCFSLCCKVAATSWVCHDMWLWILEGPFFNMLFMNAYGHENPCIYTYIYMYKCLRYVNAIVNICKHFLLYLNWIPCMYVSPYHWVFNAGPNIWPLELPSWSKLYFRRAMWLLERRKRQTYWILAPMVGRNKPYDPRRHTESQVSGFCNWGPSSFARRCPSWAVANARSARVVVAVAVGGQRSASRFSRNPKE